MLRVFEMKDKKLKQPVRKGVAKVPVIMQMEALECGAACLAMVLAYYRKWIPLEQVRLDCGVSRDGSNMKNIFLAGQHYGLDVHGYKMEVEALRKQASFPCIIHWNFNHFVVLDGFKGKNAVLNDPARGVVHVSMEEFSTSFTGLCLTFEPGENFVPSGRRKSTIAFARKRLRGAGPAVVYNSAFLIDENGANLGCYRKTHPFPTERLTCGGWTTPGTDYPVFHTAIGTIGIQICYDGDFPEIARILAVRGAQIICRPSALLRHFEIWDAENRIRAYENHVYHIAVNAVGADAAGTTYFGHSQITTPIAQSVALARAGDEVIYADLDPDPIRRVTYGSDSPMLFDHLQDRAVGTYTDDLQRAVRSAFEPARRYSF